MVDPKKPVQSAPATPAAKPTTTNAASRPPLPPFSPITITQPTSASIQPTAPAAVPAPPEKPAAPASADLQATAAPASKPASNEAKPAAAPASPAKPVEKLGPKLRRKDDILRALRGGSRVEKVDGLFRIVAPDGSKNATSKRRILSLESQKLLVASADGKTFTLDAAADKRAQTPKSEATKPVTEEKK